MALTNDVSITIPDACFDVESQTHAPRETHQRHQLETGFDQTDKLPSIPRQDRPGVPQNTLRSWITNRLLPSTTDRKAPTRSKPEVDQTQLAEADFIDLDKLEETWKEEAKKQKPYNAMRRTFPVAFRPRPGPPKPLEHAGGQVLFLCFDRVSRGQYSVRVPCLRPTRYRTPLQLKQANKKGHAEAIPPREKVVESDDHMIERMRETIESELGKWTRFVPYFGVIGAEIVEVSCSCCLVTYLLSKSFGTNNPTQVPISPSLLCTKPTADRHR